MMRAATGYRATAADASLQRWDFTRRELREGAVTGFAMGDAVSGCRRGTGSPTSGPRICTPPGWRP